MGRIFCGVPQKTGLCGAPRFRAPVPPLRNVPSLRFVAAPHPYNPLRTNRGRLCEWVLVCRAPVGLELCKAVFGGSPCYLGNKQHAQCFACDLGRQSLAHEPGALTRMDRRALCDLVGLGLRGAWFGACHRADPCKTGRIEAAPRATAIQQHVSRTAMRRMLLTCWSTNKPPHSHCNGCQGAAPDGPTPTVRSRHFFPCRLPHLEKRLAVVFCCAGSHQIALSSMSLYRSGATC
jgi:hypothetical protein